MSLLFSLFGHPAGGSTDLRSMGVYIFLHSRAGEARECVLRLNMEGSCCVVLGSF